MYPTYGASRGATTQGQDTFKLYSGMMTTGIIVGGLVGLLILYTVLRYRRRSDDMPKQFHESIPIEILYTGIPVLIVAVLFFFTVLTENNVDATVPINATVTTTGAPVLARQGHRVPVGLALRLPEQQRQRRPVRSPTAPAATDPRWSCPSERPSRSPWSPTT